MMRRVSLGVVLAVGSLLVPATAFAQAVITGLVKDASGGVLPGVSVEVASPVLIEKVRSVTTDATGQYRVVDLRPGTYSVTISLTGFKDRQARRHRAHRYVCRHSQCGSGRRRSGGNGHRQRSITDRGRPKREGAADAEQ